MLLNYRFRCGYRTLGSFPAVKHYKNCNICYSVDWEEAIDWLDTFFMRVQRGMDQTSYKDLVMLKFRKALLDFEQEQEEEALAIAREVRSQFDDLKAGDTMPQGFLEAFDASLALQAAPVPIEQPEMHEGYAIVRDFLPQCVWEHATRLRVARDSLPKASGVVYDFLDTRSCFWASLATHLSGRADLTATPVKLVEVDFFDFMNYLWKDAHDIRAVGSPALSSSLEMEQKAIIPLFDMGHSTDKMKYILSFYVPMIKLTQKEREEADARLIQVESFYRDYFEKQAGN